MHKNSKLTRFLATFLLCFIYIVFTACLLFANLFPAFGWLNGMISPWWMLIYLPIAAFDIAWFKNYVKH